MSEGSTFRGSYLSRMTPTSSSDLEPRIPVPAIPNSPFSASMNPVEDAVPIKSDLFEVEDSVVAVLLSLGGILCVFFLVPRGVTLVDPSLDVVKFTLNTTHQSYNLVVNAYLPFHNPNYVGVDISGNVQVTYYQAVAGINNKNFTIPKRATTNVTITIDASNVPMKYISTVLQHCFSFPYQLVFFIDGTFKAKYLLQSQNLSVDAYKYIYCPVSYYDNSSLEATVM
eukprot:g4542.t1